MNSHTIGYATITGLHPWTFRPGQPATILEVVNFKLVPNSIPRLYYRVEYDDGKIDFIPLSEAHGPKYAIRPKPHTLKIREKVPDTSPEVTVAVVLNVNRRFADGRYAVTYTGPFSKAKELNGSAKTLSVPAGHPAFIIEDQTLHVTGPSVDTIMKWFPNHEEISSFVVLMGHEKTFETADGQKVKEGDTVYFPDTVGLTVKVWIYEKMMDPSKLFADRIAAERYLSFNTPKLTLEEVCNEFKELSYAFSFSEGARRSFRKRMKKLIANKPPR